MIALPEDRSCGCARPRDGNKSLPRLLDVDILQKRVLDIWRGILLQSWQGKGWGNDTGRYMPLYYHWQRVMGCALDDRSMPRIRSVPPSTLELKIVAFGS
jgi:hypothetical protein